MLMPGMTWHHKISEHIGTVEVTLMQHAHFTDGKNETHRN